MRVKFIAVAKPRDEISKPLLSKPAEVLNPTEADPGPRQAKVHRGRGRTQHPDKHVSVTCSCPEVVSAPPREKQRQLNEDVQAERRRPTKLAQPNSQTNPCGTGRFRNSDKQTRRPGLASFSRCSCATRRRHLWRRPRAVGCARICPAPRMRKKKAIE